MQDGLLVVLVRFPAQNKSPALKHPQTKQHPEGVGGGIVPVIS